MPEMLLCVLHLLDLPPLPEVTGLDLRSKVLAFEVSLYSCPWQRPRLDTNSAKHIEEVAHLVVQGLALPGML